MRELAGKLHVMHDYIRLLTGRRGHKLTGEIKGCDEGRRYQPSQRAPIDSQGETNDW